MSKDDERFWSHVDIRGDNECWPWQAATCKRGGYGLFCIRIGSRRADKRVIKAGRFAYESEYGPVSAGLCVYRICHLAACCNPAHWRAGTAADRNNAAVARGTYDHKAASEWMPQAKGAAHPDAVLSADDVAVIRASDPGVPHTVLAQKWRVSEQTIRRVRSGRRYC